MLCTWTELIYRAFTEQGEVLNKRTHSDSKILILPVLKIPRSLYGKRWKSLIQCIKAIPAYIWNVYLLNPEHGFMTWLFSIMGTDWLHNSGYLKTLQYFRQSKQVCCYLRWYQVSVCKPSSLLQERRKCFSQETQPLAAITWLRKWGGSIHVSSITLQTPWIWLRAAKSTPSNFPFPD